MRPRAVASILAFAIGLVAASGGLTQAQEATPASPSIETPSAFKREVTVVLNGGLAGPNLSQILDLAFAPGSDIPTRAERISADGGSVCQILTRLGYPPPCDRYYPLLRRLNGRAIDTAVLQPEDQVLVPDIILMKERRTRVLIGRDADRDARLRRAWKDLLAELSPIGAEDTALSYDAYAFRLPAADDGTAKALAVGIRALGLDNITADARLSAPPTAAFFGDTDDTADIDDEWAEQVEEECRAGRLSSPRAYADWAASDRTARPIAKTVPRHPSTVILVDTPLAPADYYSQPKLADGAAWPSWPCAWRKEKKSDHANYLAAIIATRTNGNGMSGIAESAVLQSSPWVSVQAGQVTPDADAAARLTAMLLDDAKAAAADATRPLTVYLAALDFRIWTAEDTAFNASLRLDRNPAGPIASTGRLFIVSAGQQPDGGRDITAASLLSPQNLGDLSNVVVVSACLRCSQPSVRLMDTANYSAGDHRFVHLAAPGGAALPGWFDTQYMGAGKGTSPAAAFVAGVAADMIGAYPDYYLDARRVKERLQTTSQPLPRYNGFNQKNEDTKKIAAGVVDPHLALLDPRQHWIRQNAKWRPVRIKALGVTLLDNQGKPTGSGQTWLRRLVRKEDIVDHDAWTAIEQTRRDPSEPIGDVFTRYNVRPSKGSAMTLCNGATIKLLSLEDILLAQAGWNGDECGG